MLHRNIESPTMDTSLLSTPTVNKMKNKNRNKNRNTPSPQKKATARPTAIYRELHNNLLTSFEPETRKKLIETVKFNEDTGQSAITDLIAAFKTVDSQPSFYGFKVKLYIQY